MRVRWNRFAQKHGTDEARKCHRNAGLSAAGQASKNDRVREARPARWSARGGSEFALADGQVIKGPATQTQPVVCARERDGRIEVKEDA